MSTDATPVRVDPRRHGSRMARVLACTLGAYGLTALTTVALSRLLMAAGLAKVEAATAATLASFAIFAIAAMMAFHARSAARAWAWLAGAALPFALLLIRW